MKTLSSMIESLDLQAQMISKSVDVMFTLTGDEVRLPRKHTAGGLIAAMVNTPTESLNATKRKATDMIAKQSHEIDRKIGQVAELARALGSAADHIIDGSILWPEARKALGDDMVTHVQEVRLGLLANVIPQAQAENIAKMLRTAKEKGLKKLSEKAMTHRRMKSSAKAALLNGEHRYLVNQAKRLEKGGYCANPNALLWRLEYVGKRMDDHKRAYKKTLLAGPNFTPSKTARRPRIS